MILGVEFGSTRIKSVLTDDLGKVLFTSAYEWCDKMTDGYWSYDLGNVINGLQNCYAEIKNQYKVQNGQGIKKLSAIGISGMMHGYLVFDKKGNQLVPFRTWKNTTTAEAAEILTRKLSFNMPERWSATHFYQAVLNGESHIEKVDYITTLAGYVNYKLTGKRVIGVGDASGMFPLKGGNYDKERIDIFNSLLHEKGVSKDFKTLLPEILLAGDNSCFLTDEGARLLDPSGELEGGSTVCPPEGDAQTGMIATNSVRVCTGNVSAGTSAFAMVVLEKELHRIHREIDIVTTPTGSPVAMVHANNCTSEINAWVNLFYEVINLGGGNIRKEDLFSKLFSISENASLDVGNIFTYNFFSGEPMLKVENGLPMVFRGVGEKLNIANFMLSQIYSAVAPLNIGIQILKDEGVKIDRIYGHGGYFKTPVIGQKAMSLALDAPVTVFESAGEGGAFGIALLALYSLKRTGTLEEFLDNFYKDYKSTTLCAEEEDKKKYSNFMINYLRGIKVEKLASEVYSA